jgi:uncharacterized protein YxeA
MYLDKLTLITLIIVTLFFITCLVLLFRKLHMKNQNRFTTNKVAIRKNGRSSSSGPPPVKQQQSCSYCKRKVNPKELVFYAGQDKVVGVCKSCKPQAERQALLRL